MKLKFIGIVVMMVALSCRHEQPVREIDLSHYEEVSISEDHTYIELIKSHEADECSEGRINANVYQCLLESGDTLLIFEFCKKIPDFARNNYEYPDDRDLIIEKKNILTSFQSKIYISNDVVLRPHTKFVVGSITKLEY